MDECVEEGGTVPGGYIPSFFQRTRMTHGSAGRLYCELESRERKWGLPSLPVLEMKLPLLLENVISTYGLGRREQNLLVALL